MALLTGLGVTLPVRLQPSTLGRQFYQTGLGFKQSLQGMTVPAGLQSLRFCVRFSQSLQNVMLPDGPTALTAQGLVFQGCGQSLGDLASWSLNLDLW